MNRNLSIFIKIATIIFAIPFHCGISIFPIGILLHIYTPYVLLIYRIHNQFNPTHPIKFYIICYGKVEENDFPTISSWWKNYFTPQTTKDENNKEATIISAMSTMYFLYILSTYIIAAFFGFLIIKGLIFLIF